MPIRAAAATGALLLSCACQERPVEPQAMAGVGADAGRGRQVIERAACAACHRIPGVRWPRGQVGPSLDGFADRTLVAGRFPNRPEVLAKWVRDAPSLAPQTGMPAAPITEQEARDVAAYLYTLDAR